MTVKEMNMNMHETCSCRYNWINLTSSGERPNFNISFLMSPFGRLGGRINVQQLFLTYFNAFVWRVDQVPAFGCLSLQRAVEEIEYFALFSFV